MISKFEVTNISDQKITIKECGFILSPGHVVDFSDGFNFEQIDQFKSLHDFISAGALSVNTGDTTYSGSEWTAALQENISLIQMMFPVEVEDTYGYVSSYDTTREKQLSAGRAMVSWGTNSANAKNRWMDLWGNIGAANETGGYLVSYSGTITTMSINRHDTSSEWWCISIYKNFDQELHEICPENNAHTAWDDSLDIDVYPGDTIQCYLSSKKGIRYPVCNIEIARRL